MVLGEYATQFHYMGKYKNDPCIQYEMRKDEVPLAIHVDIVPKRPQSSSIERNDHGYELPEHKRLPA